MSADASNEKGKKKPPTVNAVSRRAILLTGTSAIVTAGLLSTASSTPAQAQQATPAAPGGRRPNILVIFGDDIGYWKWTKTFDGRLGSVGNIHNH
jgi:hypothetical protein